MRKKHSTTSISRRVERPIELESRPWVTKTTICEVSRRERAKRRPAGADFRTARPARPGPLPTAEGMASGRAASLARLAVLCVRTTGPSQSIR
jgi:hypothetical protein